MKAALCHQQPLAVGGEVANQLVGVIDKNLRANRYRHEQVFTAAAALVAPFARPAVRRLKTAVKAKIGEGVDAFLRDEVNAAAVAAVAAIRPAKRHIFFTAETDDAVAALARADVNLCFIYEFHEVVPVSFACSASVRRE